MRQVIIFITKENDMSDKKAASKKAVAGKAASGKAAAEPKKTKQTTAKKTIADTAAENKPAAEKIAKKTGSKAAKKSHSPSVAYSPEQRYRMIETAAYFIAERNGFQGDTAEHWRAAELEIAQLLGE
jgi:hypothetical protein